MSIFNRSQSKYPVSDAQAKDRMSRNLKRLAYAVIGGLALITGFHAVMIVLSETASFTFQGQTGLLLLVMTIFRLGFPLLVEAAAVIHTVGAVNGAWKGDQKTWGGFIDAVWLLFAAANMITFFAIERGAPLDGWQINWLQYGLPLSGIIAGVLVTKMILSDPAHKRAEEESAAEEERVGTEHLARSQVENSDAMYAVQIRRAWRDYVKKLEAQGYDDDEIDFMLANVPELHSINGRQRRESRPGLFDRAKAKIGIGDGVGNSTHDAPRQDTPTAPPLAHPTGQGNGPAAKPYGGAPDFTERP